MSRASPAAHGPPSPGALALPLDWASRTVRRLAGPLVVALVSALVAGGGLWWWWSADSGDEGFVLSAAATTQPAVGPSAPPAGAAPASRAGQGAAAQPGPTPGPSVTVHVAGAVATPGVVIVGGGSRVMDAVAAAGGLTSDADPSGINLARQVLDGELIVVPMPGQVLPPPVTGGVGGGEAGPATGLVDVNRADSSQLDTLPGIGPVLAERIISYREDTGPFADVEELRSVPGIGDKVFGGIRDLVTV